LPTVGLRYTFWTHVPLHSSTFPYARFYTVCYLLPPFLSTGPSRSLPHAHCRTHLRYLVYPTLVYCCSLSRTVLDCRTFVAVHVHRTCGSGCCLYAGLRAERLRTRTSAPRIARRTQSPRTFTRGSLRFGSRLSVLRRLYLSHAFSTRSITLDHAFRLRSPPYRVALPHRHPWLPWFITYYATRLFFHTIPRHYCTPSCWFTAALRFAHSVATPTTCQHTRCVHASPFADLLRFYWLHAFTRHACFGSRFPPFTAPRTPRCLATRGLPAIRNTLHCARISHAPVTTLLRSAFYRWVLPSCHQVCTGLHGWTLRLPLVLVLYRTALVPYLSGLHPVWTNTHAHHTTYLCPPRTHTRLVTFTLHFVTPVSHRTGRTFTLHMPAGFVLHCLRCGSTHLLLVAHTASFPLRFSHLHTWFIPDIHRFPATLFLHCSIHTPLRGYMLRLPRLDACQFTGHLTRTTVYATEQFACHVRDFALRTCTLLFLHCWTLGCGSARISLLLWFHRGFWRAALLHCAATVLYATPVLLDFPFHGSSPRITHYRAYTAAVAPHHLHTSPHLPLFAGHLHTGFTTQPHTFTSFTYVVTFAFTTFLPRTPFYYMHTAVRLTLRFTLYLYLSYSMGLVYTFLLTVTAYRLDTGCYAVYIRLVGPHADVWIPLPRTHHTRVLDSGPVHTFYDVTARFTVSLTRRTRLRSTLVSTCGYHVRLHTVTLSLYTARFPPSPAGSPHGTTTPRTYTPPHTQSLYVSWLLVRFTLRSDTFLDRFTVYLHHCLPFAYVTHTPYRLRWLPPHTAGFTTHTHAVYGCARTPRVAPPVWALSTHLFTRFRFHPTAPPPLCVCIFWFTHACGFTPRFITGCIHYTGCHRWLVLRFTYLCTLPHTHLVRLPLLPFLFYWVHLHHRLLPFSPARYCFYHCRLVFTFCPAHIDFWFGLHCHCHTTFIHWFTHTRTLVPTPPFHHWFLAVDFRDACTPHVPAWVALVLPVLYAHCTRLRGYVRCAFCVHGFLHFATVLVYLHTATSPPV